MTGGAADARVLARGVLRLLADMGCEGLAECSLANGRRADVLALDGTGRVLIVEIKTCAADFRADAKWTEYLAFCDAFYFAVPADFPEGLLPEDEGLIVVDRYGGAVVRPAVSRPLAAARRRALTLRVARKAAERLRRREDPGPQSL